MCLLKRLPICISDNFLVCVVKVYIKIEQNVEKKLTKCERTNCVCALIGLSLTIRCSQQLNTIIYLFIFWATMQHAHARSEADRIL